MNKNKINILKLSWSFYTFMTFIYIFASKHYISKTLLIILIIFLTIIVISLMIFIIKKDQYRKINIKKEIISKEEHVKHNISIVILLFLIGHIFYLIKIFNDLFLDKLKVLNLMYIITITYLVIFNICYFSYFKRYNKRISKSTK